MSDGVEKPHKYRRVETPRGTTLFVEGVLGSLRDSVANVKRGPVVVERSMLESVIELIDILADRPAHPSPADVRSGEPVRRDWAKAHAAGCVFYELPDVLNYDSVDPLIQPVCRAINASGWVATAESCQGHPDTTEPHPWGFNTGPYLRLVVAESDAGRMLALLVDSTRQTDDRLYPLTYRVGQHRAKDGWCEYFLYANAATAYERDQAVTALQRFADALEASSPPDVRDAEAKEREACAQICEAFANQSKGTLEFFDAKDTAEELARRIRSRVSQENNS